MDCLWIKRGGGLFPADPVTEEQLAAFGNAQMVTTDAPRKRRHPEFHKLMMAGLSELVANTYPRFADVDAAMLWLKVQAKMLDRFDFKDGSCYWIPQSVSFASMDQVRFKAVSEQWRAIALEEFGIDLLREREDEL